MSHRPEPSGRALRGEVDGLDTGGQHDQRVVILRHAHGAQRPYAPFAQAGAVTSDTGAEAVKPEPRCSWRGHSRRVGADVEDESAESCRVFQPPPHSIGDPPSAPHYVIVR